MRRIVHGLATAMLLLSAAGCNVTDNDIEHWKRTQRGPRKITTVLVQSSYALPMRVHAARALIEMKHPNANGLELLQAALQSMASSEREQIVHALLPELGTMLRAQGSTPTQGPTDAQMRAKDAAYVIIRGDGRTSFASAEDRAALSTMVLDWLLADFNQRALAGSYTAEQVVNAIGPSSAERLTQSLTSADEAIPVSVELAKLIHGVGTPDAQSAAATRLVGVCREMEGDTVTARLRARAQQLLTQPNAPAPNPDAVARGGERLRDQYFTVLFEAVRTLGRPPGTDYLLGVGRNAAVPLARRKLALTALANSLSSQHTAGLLEVVNCADGPTCDMDLRGLAVDRIGETRDRGVVPQLFTLFDNANGGVAGLAFTLRWKLGEAILRLGGPSILPEFMQHLGPRPAPFGGYTFSEINGEAQAIGDMTPTPRDAMRAYTAASHPVAVRLLALMYLGIKGEERDLATLQSMASDATAVQGEGWSDEQLGTVGAVATRAREQLQRALRAAQPSGNTNNPAQ